MTYGRTKVSIQSVDIRKKGTRDEGSILIAILFCPNIIFSVV